VSGWGYLVIKYCVEEGRDGKRRHSLGSIISCPFTYQTERLVETQIAVNEFK